MIKKMSISWKLFLSLSLLVISVLLTVFVLNSVILENYYLHYKEKNLAKMYQEINEIYSNNLEPLSIKLELEKLESNQNIDIVIKDKEKITIYSTSKDFSNNIFFITNYTKLVNSDYLMDKLSNGTEYFIELIKDNKLHSDFVALFGKLTPDNFIFIRTPMESIKESVTVTNDFLLIIGIISIILSSIFAFLITKNFTKPLNELNSIAQSISNLDFSKKYNATSSDEFGTLGTSINKLSNSLENKIKELHEINIELEKDVESKSKLAEMRSQFVSDVSHELKTPIALIQGYAEGLVDGIATTEEDKKYYCEVILDEANKMSELTHDLLDLSNLEYGKNNINIQSFDIIELISNVIKKNEIIFSEKSIKVYFETNYTTLYVNADIFRIEQVLTNYINNAIKNIDDNKILKLSASINEGKVRISVFNSGKNIDEENLMKIWTKFFKVDASRNRDLSGSGIGLSLVKAIMDQHHNKYGVCNLSEGVEFWFELDLSEDTEIK